MNDDMILSIVTAGAWLVVAISALASYRLSWGKMVTMVLVWVAIFGAVVIAVEWFQTDSSSAQPNSDFT